MTLSSFDILDEWEIKGYRPTCSILTFVTLCEVVDQYHGVLVFKINNVNVLVILIGSLRLEDQIVVNHVPRSDLSY